jgi:carboxyl-terminal processing protease
MAQAQPSGARVAALRFAALLFAVALIFLGAKDLLTRARASTADDDDPDYPRLFDDVERHLKQHYLDQERIGPRARKLTEKALSSVENMIDEIYVENSDPDNPHVVVHVGGKSKVLSLARIGNVDQGIEALKDLSDFFKANYHGKRSLNDIRHYAMNGFLSGLDPHTQVFDAKGFRDFSVHIEGEIFGVGMYVGATKGVLTVKKVLKGTPAERAGFKRGDRIAKIGDESTVNMAVDEAVRKIRGLEHSKVVLTVKRKEPGENGQTLTLPIEVERERVTIPSVLSKLLPLQPKPEGSPAPGGGSPSGEPTAMGYVQVNNFDKNTVPSLKESLDKLRQENGGRELGGLILDLRDNSGGLLQQASDMADLFLKEGEIYWIAQKGREEAKLARNDGREPRYPMVVLANDLSASGAEIVIGALQKNNRAVVLGTPTFGKGSVQQLHPLQNDWQLKITVSEYLIPGKVSIQENGVIPDIYSDRVVLNDKLTNLFPNRRMGTERDYDDHIVSRYAKREEPKERIKYLYNLEDPEVDDPDAPEPAGYGEVEPEKDTLTQVALQLLECASKDGGSKGSAPKDSGSKDSAPKDSDGQETFRADLFLKNHAADIDRIRHERFNEIVKRLQDRGIDWQDGQNPESPAIELAVEHHEIEKPSTDKDDPVPKPYLVVKARATNRSSQPLYRIKALTESDYYFYREQEFLFGRIEPGATVERKAEIQIPYYPFARNDSVKLTVSGGDGKTILEREHEVVLPAQERPAFAYSATLLDKARKEPIQKLASGEEALIELKAINIGKAAAHKGVAILRNLTGPEVFLEPPGRIEFSELPPGKETEVEFGFRITPGSKVKSYKFELVIADPYSGENLSREIEIPAQGAEGPGFANGQRFQPPQVDGQIADVEAALSTRSGGGGAEGAGREPQAGSLLVTDRAEVELSAKVSASQAPFNAWVTDSPLSLHEREPDKVYFAASRGSDDLRFTARVPLKKGTNLIHVVASDENGLQNREVLVVRRR